MPAMLNRFCRTAMHLYPFPNGQGRLIDQSFMGRLKFTEPTLKVRCAGGFHMRVLPNDHIGRHLYLTGRFDPSIVRVLQSFCTGEDRILDIGANCGSVSCALLNAFPRCRVVAVEPQPHVFALLAENLAEVGGDRAKALNVAISDREGAGQMALTDGNTGGSRLVPPTEAAGPRLDVKMISGQRLFEVSGLDRVDLIKIDVEGFEETVLRALAGTIQTQRPRAILFEHHGDLNRPDARIRGFFDECGYRLSGLRKTLWKDSLVPLEQLAASGEHGHDYVATPVA